MDRSMLQRATSQDDDPTPGYLFTEISKMTHGSVEACDKLREFLVDRLKKENANIKYKSLLVIKHVAKNGRQEFKRSFQRDTDAIKACLQFRGPPDPLRGDEPYRRVRDTAKEALEAIFSTTGPVAGVAGSRIQGFGSDPVAAAPTTGYTGSGSPAGSYGPPSAAASVYPPTTGSGGITRTSATGMVGFGNYDPHADTSIFDKVMSTAAAVVNVASAGLVGPGGAAPAVTGPPRVEGGPADYNYASNRGPTPYGATTPGYQGAGASTYDSESTGVAPRVPGQPGGGWGSATMSGAWGPASTAAAAATPTYGVVTPSPAASAPPAGPRAGGAQTDGEYERTIVATITAPGGLRAEPPKDQLDDFCRRCVTLSPALVGDLLLERAADTNPQVVKKTLHVLEAVAATTGLDGIVSHIRGRAGVLAQVAASTDKPSVRSHVTKVMHLYGAGGAAPAAAAPRATSSGADLLDFRSPSSATPTTPAAAPASTDVAADLFGGMTLSAPAPAPSPAPASIFGSAPAPAPAPAPAVDMFRGMQTSTPAPATFFSAPAPAPAAAAPFFGAPAPAPAAAPMFGMAPAPAPVSGFSFAAAPTPSFGVAAPVSGGLPASSFAFGVPPSGMAPAPAPTGSSGFAFMPSSPAGAAPMAPATFSSPMQLSYQPSIPNPTGVGQPQQTKKKSDAFDFVVV